VGQDAVHVTGDAGALAFGGAFLVRLTFAFQAQGAFGERGRLGAAAWAREPAEARPTAYVATYRTTPRAAVSGEPTMRRPAAHITANTGIRTRGGEWDATPYNATRTPYHSGCGATGVARSYRPERAAQISRTSTGARRRAASGSEDPIATA
jgi:hypothetical protein